MYNVLFNCTFNCNFCVACTIFSYFLELTTIINSYSRFCLLLISVFQSTLINDHQITRQTIQKLKEFVEEISKHITDSVYNRIGEAYKHVLSAVTAHILFLNGDLTEEASKSVSFQFTCHLSSKIWFNFNVLVQKRWTEWEREREPLFTKID